MRILSRSGTYWLILSMLASWSSQASPADIQLRWRDTSANESGFKIERLDGAQYVQIATVGANVQSYTDSGLATASNYCYRVSAFNSAGASAPSNTACATAAESLDSTQSTATGSSSTTDSTLRIAAWADYQISMKIRSADDDTIGVVFRYQDSRNYYRFTWNSQFKFRRLEKREGGVFRTLAHDAVGYTTGQTYGLTIVAQGTALKISIDGKTIFSVVDSSFAHGSFGLYSYYNEGSYFDDIVVTDLVSGNAHVSADFNDGRHVGWTFIDEGNDAGPSRWTVSNGALVQTSNIGSTRSDLLGTHALYTRGNWQDYRATLKIRSDDDDPMGIIFRFLDPDNYYRFSWDRESPGRRLFKREKGVFKLLAEDAVAYTPGRTYSLEVIVQGNSLKINIDGNAVFAATDTSFKAGTIGLFSSHNAGAYFDDVYVEDLATKTVLLADDFNDGNLFGWTVVDESGTQSGPSAWSVFNGQALQSTNIGSDDYGTVGTILLY